MDLDCLANLSNVVMFAIRHVVHMSVLWICIGIFAYQAAWLPSAKFLKNLAAAYALMSVSYANQILLAIITFLTVHGSGYTASSAVSAESVRGLVRQVDSVWMLVDVLLSFCSTFLLYRAWYYVHIFPNTGLPRRWRLINIGAVGVVISLVSVVLNNPKGVGLVVIGTLDVTTGCVAALLTAWAFLKLRSQPAYGAETLLPGTIRVLAFASFAMWGLLQLPFLIATFVHEMRVEKAIVEQLSSDVGSQYFTALMVAKVACAITASAIALGYAKEK